MDFMVIISETLFFGEIKQILKSNKISSRKKDALELLHHRLGKRSTI